MRTHLTIITLVLTGLLIPTVASGALGQSYQQTGNIGLEMTGDAVGTGPSLTGTLTVSPSVVGPVQKAFLYTNDWNAFGNLDLTFGGVPVGNALPFASDTALSTLYAYRWDVTAQVGGPGVYNYAIGQSFLGNQLAGVALAVIYTDPSAPLTTVSIIDGAKQLGDGGVPETESATFTGLPSGATTLYTFTVSDDSVDSGEVVKYNGISVGGPIDQGLGLNATLLQMPATSLAGSNGVSITTGTPSGTDHFGWIVAATEVPEPAIIATLSVAGLAALRRRRR